MGGGRTRGETRLFLPRKRTIAGALLHAPAKGATGQCIKPAGRRTTTEERDGAASGHGSATSIGCA